MRMSPLPEVSRRDFDAYVQQLRLARRRAGLSEAPSLDEDAAEADEAAAFRLGGSAGSAEVAALLAGAGAGAGSAHAQPPPAQSQAEARASSDLALRQMLTAQGSPDAFATVPPEYFDPGYSLRAPGVFEALLLSGRRAGRGPGNPFGAGAGAGARSELDEVQDRMAAHLDSVECHLLAATRARSRQFFEALSQLQELRDRVLDANITAKVLHRHITRVRAESCTQPLTMIALFRRRRRREQVLDLLSSVKVAAQAPSRVGQLYHAGDLAGALDVVEQTNSLIAAKMPRIVALAYVRKKMEHFAKAVGNDLVDRYTRAAVAIATVGSAAGVSVGGLASGGAGGEMDVEWELQTSVWPLLVGLLRVGRLAEAVDTFQVALIREMIDFLAADTAEAVSAVEASMASPKPAGDYLAPTIAAGGAGAAAGAVVPLGSYASAAGANANEAAAGRDVSDRLQALSPSGFLEVAASMARAATGVLQRVGDLHDAVERVLDAQSGGDGRAGSGTAAAAAAAAAAAPPPASPPSALQFAAAPAGGVAVSAAQSVEAQVDRQRLRALSCGQVAVAVDTAQRRLAALLSARREQSARMRVSDLRALWDVTSAFNASAAGVLARAGVGAGGAGVGLGVGAPGAAAAAAAATAALSRSSDECLYHAKSMLHYAHTRNLASLGAMLDAEAWRQTVVPRPVQAIADAISQAVSASAQPSSAFVIQQAAMAVEYDALAQVAAVADAAAAAAVPAGKTLVVGGAHFFMVGTGVMLVKMLGDYSSIAEAVPEVAGEAIQSTVQLLRHFNRSATQLVLGAGALQTAGLKRITAKHLAMTSQTLSAIVALLPSIRALLLMRLPPHQHALLSDLANVTADILAHDNRIRAKFVAIVKDLTVKCVDDMRALPWGDADAQLTLPSVPIGELGGGIATLHRILRSVFRQDQLADIYCRILVMLNANLPGQCAALISHLAMEQQRAAAAVRVAAATAATAAATAAAAAVGQGGHAAPGAAAAAAAAANAAAAAAASAARKPKFARDVAVRRLGVDLRGFLAELRALADATTYMDDSDADAFAAAGDEAPRMAARSSASASQLLAAASGVMAPGLDALAALDAWLQSSYGPDVGVSVTAAAAPDGTSSQTVEAAAIDSLPSDGEVPATVAVDASTELTTAGANSLSGVALSGELASAPTPEEVGALLNEDEEDA